MSNNAWKMPEEIQSQIVSDFSSVHLVRDSGIRSWYHSGLGVDVMGEYWGEFETNDGEKFQIKLESDLIAPYREWSLVTFLPRMSPESAVILFEKLVDTFRDQDCGEAEDWLEGKLYEYQEEAANPLESALAKQKFEQQAKEYLDFMTDRITLLSETAKTLGLDPEKIECNGHTVNVLSLLQSLSSLYLRSFLADSLDMQRSFIEHHKSFKTIYQNFKLAICAQIVCHDVDGLVDIPSIRQIFKELDENLKFEV